jgi:hypothetical protein
MCHPSPLATGPRRATLIRRPCRSAHGHDFARAQRDGQADLRRRGDRLKTRAPRPNGQGYVQPGLLGRTSLLARHSFRPVAAIKGCGATSIRGGRPTRRNDLPAPRPTTDPECEFRWLRSLRGVGARWSGAWMVKAHLQRSDGDRESRRLARASARSALDRCRRARAAGVRRAAPALHARGPSAAAPSERA